MLLLTLSGTHCLTAFDSVNLLTTFWKHLKNVFSFGIFRHSLVTPVVSDLIFNFLALYKSIYLLNLLLTYLHKGCLV